MNIFLTLAFLFCIGSVFGWLLEVVFRRFFSSSNLERRWINPGFCTGPYLPLYGFGLCLIYLIASLEQYSIVADPLWNKLLLFLMMAVIMTALEYLAGLFTLKVGKVRLWDYSREWGNIQGIICPKFSCIWAALGALYYFLVHPRILSALDWLSRNLAFSFVIGLFFGVFLIDVAHSLQLTAKLKKYAEDNDVIVKYEAIKEHIRSTRVKGAKGGFFYKPFYAERPLREYLNELKESFEKRKPGRNASSKK